MLDLVRWLGLNTDEVAERFKQANAALPLFHERKYISSAPNSTRQILHDFFKPHNQRLFKLLRTKGFNTVAALLEQLWAQEDSSLH